jgi:serine/threonine-protein kinase
MNSSLPSPYPSPGEVIDGKYQIDKILGEGGMGCVARAYHTILRKAVAVKFMNPMFMSIDGAVQRFINEGVASGRIKSDHVVPVNESGKLPSGAPYLVMECLHGLDLADLLARDGSPGLPTARALHFTLQILRGLQAAHAAGIIHRDMKPSNCFVVNNDGEDDFIKILDFGISKVAQPGQSASLTQTNSALGTPLYMSPEQARSPRDVDGRSDIYSVGVILYEMLTGHTPFFSDSGEFTEILFKLFTADPPPVKSTRPDLPDALAAAVHKALAREPANRFESPAAMVDALAPFADERSKLLVARIRAFKPEQARSLPPPEGMTPSMVAFSQLDAKPVTDVMANRPTTDVMAHPPVTQVMDQAPPRIVMPTPRADAHARTALDTSSKSQGAASTDLGASRDTSQMEQRPPRSPLVWILPIAVLGMIGGGLGIVAVSRSHANGTTNPTPPPPPSSVVVVVSAPPSIVTPPPPPPASASSSAPTPTKPPTRNNTIPNQTGTSPLDRPKLVE